MDRAFEVAMHSVEVLGFECSDFVMGCNGDFG